MRVEEKEGGVGVVEEMKEGRRERWRDGVVKEMKEGRRKRWRGGCGGGDEGR